MSQGAPQSQRKERNAAATRQRLLDAAEHEFAARGFPGARLREIADAASVQPALIHHYFDDKQGLYRAVLDRALAPTSTLSWSILESTNDLAGLVRGFVSMLVDYYAEHQALLAMLRHEAADGSPVWKEVTRERMLPILEAVRLFLRELRDAGELRDDLEIDEVIMASISMCVHPFSEALMVRELMPTIAGTSRERLEQRKTAIVAVLMQGLRK